MKQVLALGLFLAALVRPCVAGSQNAAAQPPLPAANMIFDVRNGDQRGKLVIGDTEMAFESLTDARHSQRWKFAEIRELTKKGKKEIRLRPMRGSRYDFQFSDRQGCDKVHELITARILAARAQVK